MKSTFLKAKKYVEQQFPEEDIKIVGANYPVPPIVQLVLGVLQIVQLFSMAAAIFGDNVWSWFRVQHPPEIYYKCKDYGVAYFIAIFFIAPRFFNKWVITGAFEVVLDGVLIFSKLETGRMPSAEDLTGPLVKAGLQQVAAS